MESNFNNREFEQYVKDNADHYRMIPSEKVWKGINNTLHTRRKWYGLGLIMLLLLIGVSVTWVMVSYPNSKKQEIASVPNVPHSVQIQAAKQGQSPATESSNNAGNIISFNKFIKQENIPATGNLSNGQVNNNNETSSASFEFEGSKTVDAGTVIQAEKSPVIISEKKVVTAPSATIVNTTAISETSNLIQVPDKKVPGDKPAGLIQNNPVKNNSNYYPLTIESVVNVYHANKASKRLIWELFITPTVSYRKWSANKSFDGNVPPFASVSYPFASSGDVNSEVIHKPDMGLEVGFSTKYPLTKSLKLTGGLQFNINRYDIKAFASSGEQATINLNGGTGNNSVTAWTYYRNYNGYKSDWLKNFYFSVSAPVGAELRLFGNDKTSFGIAGTVQPTYILKDRAFLISTDYKNYVEIPRLIRHLNVNTSFETFVSYTSRHSKTRWQIGPQVRYQVLSSFQSKYPVKENLFDFGLKLGVTLNH
jgi:hypothetical protein